MRRSATVRHLVPKGRLWSILARCCVELTDRIRSAAQQEFRCLHQASAVAQGRMLGCAYIQLCLFSILLGSCGHWRIPGNDRGCRSALRHTRLQFSSSLEAGMFPCTGCASRPSPPPCTCSPCSSGISYRDRGKRQTQLIYNHYCLHVHARIFLEPGFLYIFGSDGGDKAFCSRRAESASDPVHCR
jgi:hypothetical protein